jgi:hypothetical protein
VDKKFLKIKKLPEMLIITFDPEKSKAIMEVPFTLTITKEMQTKGKKTEEYVL